MSYGERSAWARLVTTLAVYLPYFAYIANSIGSGEFSIGAVMEAFILAVICSIVLIIVVHAILVIRFGREQRDERDTAIDARSLKVAYFFLVSIFFTALCGIAVPLALATTAEVSALPGFLLASQVMLLCFVLAEMVRFTTQIVGYRRGI
jgi:hypothetical protein